MIKYAQHLQWCSLFNRLSSQLDKAPAMCRRSNTKLDNHVIARFPFAFAKRKKHKKQKIQKGPQKSKNIQHSDFPAGPC